MSRKLTKKQIDAAYWLATGESATYVADRLNLRRETLSRWKKQKRFNEEYENVIADIRFSMEKRILQLVKNSIYAIENEIQNPNCNEKRIDVALKLLKMLKIDEIIVNNAPKLVENEVKMVEISPKMVEIVPPRPANPEVL